MRISPSNPFVYFFLFFRGLREKILFMEQRDSHRLVWLFNTSISSHKTIKYWLNPFLYKVTLDVCWPTLKAQQIFRRKFLRINLISCENYNFMTPEPPFGHTGQSSAIITLSNSKKSEFIESRARAREINWWSMHSSRFDKMPYI